jgi:3-deoxy-D-manno-octulosonic-acid transferase
MLGAAYRGVMTVIAGAARGAGWVPGAPESWRALGERLGDVTAAERAIAAGAPALWIHAASVGELGAVRPLVAQLRTRFPGRACIVSTLTRTGLGLARTMREAHVARLLPLDAPGVVARTIREIRLEAFFFTETEIWPTWLVQLGEAGIPAFMVSGRVSERTLAHGRWLRPLYRAALAPVVCCMQTDEDAARIVALGAEPVRVHVAGCLKFDAGLGAPPAEIAELAASLAAGARRLIVAGSTHEGEEAMVLDAYDRVVRGHRDTVLLLAPRHPERLEQVAAAVTARRMGLVRYGALVAGRAALPDAPAVVLLDVVGPLAHCYGLGEVAFVGGSLVPVGGHNVIEPARLARPVVVGPHTANARELVERLLAARAAVRVQSVQTLAWTLDHLLAHPDEAATMGLRAQALVQTGQGAVERHMKIIAARLESARFARDGAA